MSFYLRENNSYVGEVQCFVSSDFGKSVCLCFRALEKYNVGHAWLGGQGSPHKASRFYYLG